MESSEITDVDVADTVAVGHHEGFVTYVLSDAPDAPAGHGVQTGVHHRHFPGLGVLVVIDDLVVAAEIEGNVGMVEEVVGKPVFDHVLFVTGAHDKVIEAVERVLFHDVPKDRHAADFNEGLRTKF